MPGKSRKMIVRFLVASLLAGSMQTALAYEVAPSLGSTAPLQATIDMGDRTKWPLVADLSWGPLANLVPIARLTPTQRAANVLRDVELAFDFTIVTADTKASVHLRSNSGVLDSVAGVSLDLTPTNVFLNHVTSGAWTRDVTKAKDHTRGVTYRARVIVATQTGGATLIRARTWPITATAP